MSQAAGTLILADLNGLFARFAPPEQAGVTNPTVSVQLRRSEWVDLGRPVELHVALVIP